MRLLAYDFQGPFNLQNSMTPQLNAGQPNIVVQGSFLFDA